MWCNVAYAEKFLCSYIFNEEAKSVVFERKGNFFKKSNNVSDEIVFEDEYSIVLSNTYSRKGKETPITFTTLIDKKKLTFTMIALEYQNTTAPIEGNCKIF